MAEQTGLSNSGSVIQQDPEPSFSGDVKLIKSLQSAFPEYRGQNPHHLKNKLITDNDFFSEVSGKYFSAIETSEMQSMEPEQRQALQSKFARNFKKDLVQSAYVGKSMKDTLVDRSLSLRDKPTDVPVERFKDIISSNPKEYQKYGLFNDDGEFTFDNDTASNITLAQEIFNSEELHRKLQTDFFGKFEQDLASAHNSPSLVTDDINNYTSAYKIYEKYTGEGLTQYMNMLQHGDASEEESIGQSFQRRQEAEQWFANKDVETDIKEFVAGKRVQGTPFDDLINSSLDKGVAPSLLAGMIRQESAFKPNAISDAGAVGLLQFMPAFARESGLNVPDQLYELDVARMNATGRERQRLTQELAQLTKKLSTPETDDRLNPEKSISAGINRFSERLRKYNYDPEKAVASWNAGASRIDQAIADSSKYGMDWKEFIPQEETRPHIEKVLGYANEYGTPTPLVYEPVTPTKDLSEPLPKDMNRFTVAGYERDNEQYQYKADDQLKSLLLKNFSNKEVSEYLNDVQLKEEAWEISDENKDMTWELYKYAYSGEGAFSMEDLTDTVMANSVHSKEDGYDKYTFNYDKLPLMGKVAFNVLQQDPNSSSMINMEGEDKTWSIMPERLQRNRERVTQFINEFKNTKTVAETDDEGNVTYKEVPDNSGLGGVWNTMVSGVGALGHTLFKYAYQPAVSITADVMDSMKVGDTREGQAFADDIEDLAGVSIFDVYSEDNGGALPNSLAMAGDMVQYMGAMYAGGAGIMKLGAKGLQAITGVKKATDMLKYTSHMGKGSERLGAMSLKLSNSLKNKAPWKTGFGVFVPGGAAIEATQPASTSFFEMVPEMLGYEPTNDVRKLYTQANRWTQMGMDLAGSVVFDRFADHVLAAGKFGKDKAMQKWFNKKEFKSVSWDATKNQWKKVSTPQYRTEFDEFWTNMTTGLDELPMGAVGESFVPKAGIKSMNGFVKSFTDENADILTNIKKDIEDNVRWFNDRLGDTKLNDDEIADIVATQYDSFLQGATDRIYGVLKHAGDDTVTRFTNALEAQTPVIRQIDNDVRNLHKYREAGQNVIAKDGKIFELDGKFWTNDMARALRERALHKTNDEVVKKISDQRGLPKDNLSQEQVKELTSIRQSVERTIGTTVRTEDGKLGYIVDFDDYGYTIKTEDGVQKVKQFEEFTNEQVDMITQRVGQMRQTQGWNPLEMRPQAPEQRPLGLPARGATGPAIELPARNLPRQQAALGLPEPKYARPPRSEVERFMPERRLEGDIEQAEGVLAQRINDIDNRISDLRQRYDNMDMIEPDDGTRRGIVKRQINRDIQELEGLKQQRQRELSEFYTRNPEVMQRRAKGIVDQRHSVRTFNAEQAAKQFENMAEKSYTVTKANTKIPFCT